MSDWVSDPDATLQWAAGVLTSRRVDSGTRARAWHAAAIAHMERGDLALARRAARHARTVAGPELSLVLAWIELDAGNTRASLRHLNAAQPHLARTRCLRGLNLCVAGRYEPAHHELSLAVEGLRADRHWLANALNGRGVVRMHLRRFAAADRDLAAAAQLYTTLGERERAATCVHNRGCVALQAGDVPGALRFFDEAVTVGLQTSARPEALIDRAHALLTAGLALEAAEVLATAANQLGDTGRSMRLAEAWLGLARCARSPELALDAARRAAALFRAQRRPGWLAAAQSVELCVTLSTPPDARRVAGRCVRHGFLAEAAELRLAVGTPDLLRLVEAHRRSGPPRLRALGWLARARLADCRRGVLAACRAGLRTGAVDVAGELVDTGLAALLPGGSPAVIFRWLAQVAVEDVVRTLGDAAMLYYVEHDGGLFAVSVVDGRVRLHDLTTCRAHDVEALRFGLGARADGVVERVARRLDRALVEPVREVVEGRPLVVVPSAVLHGLPWAALPSCAGRAVSVAPSVAGWLRASRVGWSMDNPVWVAGPGLRHADREVAALHRRWGGTLITSRESTVDRVRSVLDGAGVVHIAAHGRYRPEAPLYSYLELVDGPLYGHDLDVAPRLIVLSACEAALSTPLFPGTRAMIASTVPVADAAAVELVSAFYEHLQHGPAEALARAQVGCGDRGFVCMGAG
jgi:tetratricopeptide (TPR) repeat protein